MSAQRKPASSASTRMKLFKTSDVVSVHLVLGERTRGIVGAHELGLMKPTAILVNTARGPLIDESALIKTLQEGRIAGAGLDVFTSTCRTSRSRTTVLCASCPTSC